MLTDETLRIYGGGRRDEIGDMARELLARREVERCVMAATTAELEDRDSGDEWLAVEKAQAALDSLLGREPFDKAYDRTHEATR